MSWLDSVPAGETAITAITAAELRYGVHRLPHRRRKNDLSEAVQAIITTDFRGRVQPYDVLAADQHADVVTARERIGHPISTTDAQIASICRALQATLATWNTYDFADTGTDLVDPWRPADS